MKNMDKVQGTHCTKMGADSSAKNSPNAPEFICPILSAQAQNSGFQWKKASLGILSPCSWTRVIDSNHDKTVLDNQRKCHVVEEKLDDRIKSDLQIFVFPLYVPMFCNFFCRFSNAIFFNFNPNCSNLLGLKYYRSKLKKHSLSKIVLTFHCLNKLI